MQDDLIRRKEKPDCIYVQYLGSYVMRAADNLRFDTCQGTLISRNHSLKNDLIHFIRTIIVKMVRKRSLDYLFEQLIESWTQLLIVMNPFSRCVQKFFWLVSPVTKFTHKSIEEATTKLDQKMKPIDSPFSIHVIPCTKLGSLD